MGGFSQTCKDKDEREGGETERESFIYYRFTSVMAKWARPGQSKARKWSFSLVLHMNSRGPRSWYVSPCISRLLAGSWNGSGAVRRGSRLLYLLCLNISPFPIS